MPSLFKAACPELTMRSIAAKDPVERKRRVSFENRRSKLDRSGYEVDEIIRFACCEAGVCSCGHRDPSRRAVGTLAQDRRFKGDAETQT